MSPSISSAMLVIAAVLALTVLSGCDSEPLSGYSARDIGEYANVPWGAPGSVIVPNSREDRVRDLNFTVARLRNMSQTTDSQIDDVAQSAIYGRLQQKRMLLELFFWDGPERIAGPMQPIGEYWARIDRVLRRLKELSALDSVAAIVLAEENIHYDGRPEVLKELYRRIHQDYDVPVWQWWSQPHAIPSSADWVPADGWVIDPYFMPESKFRDYVRHYVITGKPVAVMLYASSELPGHPPMTPEQWQTNRDQLEIALEFNLPTTFFWTLRSGTRFGCRRDGGGTAEIDRINAWIWDHISRVQRLPEDYVGLSTADDARAPALDITPDEDAATVIYEDNFSSQICVTDATMNGFRDLIMDGKTLLARGFAGRRFDDTLIYHFQSDRLLASPRASLYAETDFSFGGEVSLSLSTDGRRWTSPESAFWNSEKTITAKTALLSRFDEVTEFWVRIRLKGIAGTTEEPPVRIDDFYVEADVVPDE